VEFLCAPVLTVYTAEDEFCGERGDGLSGLSTGTLGTLMDGRNPLVFNPMMFSFRALAGFSGNNPMHGRNPHARPTPDPRK
jgi:hypothetical protein